MKRAMTMASTMLLAAPLAVTAAQADDRDPNARERASLSTVLRSNGFVSWGEIELDDGRWEVDDARHTSGRVFDVDISGGRIMKRERD